jgi:hypothetical protein
LLQRATLALLLLSVACGAREDAGPGANGGEPPPTDAAPAPTADSRQPAASRPETREDTVLIEGMPEVEVSRLVNAPAGFVVPFTTYVPTGLEPDITAPSTARFTAAFADNVNPNAYMEVFVHPPGTARPAVADILNHLMTARHAAEHETVSAERPSWALESSGFRYIGADGTNFTGNVIVAQHGDVYFHVVRHYPVEYGDGLPPRLHTILRLWQWQDTGTMLMR